MSTHEPCPKCKSRDNLARYSDGSAWCFGCGYYEKSNSLILEDLKDRLKKIDEISLLEVLEIDSEMLVDRFIDIIEDKQDELEEELE